MTWRVPTVRRARGHRRRHGGDGVYRCAISRSRRGSLFILHAAEQYGAAIALADGRLEVAEAMMQRSEEAGRLLTGRDASGTFGIQVQFVASRAGWCELAPVIRVLAGGEREHGPWRPGLASLLVELGMEADARRELARVAQRGTEPVPPSRSGSRRSRT